MVVVMKNGRAGREVAIRWLGELTRLTCLALETNVGREQVSEMDGKQLHSFVSDGYYSSIVLSLMITVRS
jgi:hypothetical protein